MNLQARNVIYLSSKYLGAFRCMATQEPAPASKLKMGGWQIHGYSSDLDELQYSDKLRLPQIRSSSECLVRVRTTSVNPIDVAMARGYGKAVLNAMRCQPSDIEFPLTLGREFCGELVHRGMGADKKTQLDEASKEGADFEEAISMAREIVADKLLIMQASSGFPPNFSRRMANKEVFVFDRFEGDFFQEVQQTKAVIIGPRCLITCLRNDQRLPLGNGGPVYTTAMRDLKIATTGKTQQETEKLRVLIQWMGGTHLKNLTHSATHIISTAAKGEKYERATKRGIPAMHVDWVQRVWERSLNEYVSATDREFQIYRLPIDTNITSTCQPIPLGNSMVCTKAMRHLKIFATGITPQDEEKLRELICVMGGTYLEKFMRSMSVLISTEIRSTEYQFATENGIPVMHVDWVQRVYDRSCVDENVWATHEEFDKYRLPIFFNTNITCTGLETAKKDEVMRHVNENGGTYHGTFHPNLIDIVITEPSKTNSEKYLAAVRNKKDILVPKWIFESVEKGYALPTKKYKVKSLKVSTPTKTGQTIADFTQTDISPISMVSGSHMRRTINESAASSSSMNVGATARAPPVTPDKANDLEREVLTKSGADAHYRTVLKEICLKEAKKAGVFLDGCCIYLSGFRNEEREKLNRILNVGGATRDDVVNEKITHIIVGQIDNAEFKTWKSKGLLSAVNIVHLDWLLESMKRKQPASENIYRVSLPTSRDPDAPSPSSKRTLHAMNSIFKQPQLPSKRRNLFDKELYELSANTQEDPLPVPVASSTGMPFVEEEHDLIAQYSQESGVTAAAPLPPIQKSRNQSSANVTLNPPPPLASSTQHLAQKPAVATPMAAGPLPPTSELTTATIDYVHLDFLQGASVYIDKESFEEDVYTQLINECKAALGNVVESTFRDPVDFALVSFQRTLDETTLPVKAHQVVTDLYVDDCMTDNKLLPVEYFHKHIPHTANSMPLVGMTIVISIYTRLEKNFIDSIAQLLGAKTNTTYTKEERPLLVCPKPEGSKYQASLKWGFPAVTSMWLVRCAETGSKLPYESFLVGDGPADFAESSTTSDQSNSARSQDARCKTPLNPEQREADVQPVHVRPPNVMDLSVVQRILSSSNEEDRKWLVGYIRDTQKNQTPEVERLRREALNPTNQRCAETGSKLPYESFLVGDGPADFAESSTTSDQSNSARSNVQDARTPETPLNPEQREADVQPVHEMDVTVSDTLLVPYTPSPNDSGRDNSPAGSVICHEETVLEGPSTSKMGHQTETFNRPIARSSDPATPVPPTTFRSSSLTERGIFANDSPNLAKDITVSDTLLVPYTPSPNDSGRDNSPAGSVICHEETVLEGPSTSKMGHQTETFNRPIARSSDPATPVPPTTFRSSSLTERGIFANDSPNLAKDITVSDTLLVPYTPSPNDSGRDNSPAGSVICHEETVLEGPSTSKMGHQTETFNRPIARSSDPATPVPPTTFRSSSLTERGIFANDSPNLAKDITVSDTLLVPYTPSPNDSGRDNSPAGSVICHEETVLEGPSTSKMGHQTETFNRPIARSSDPATPVPPTTFRSSSLTERGIFANDSPNLAKDITVSDTLLVPYTPSPNDSGRDNSPAGSVICHEETVLEGPSTSKMGHQTETFNRPIARSSDPATPVPPTTFRSSSLTERGIFANDSPNLAKDITVSDTLLVPYTPSPNDSGRDNSPAGSVICHEETVLEGPSTSKMGHQTETFNRPIARSSDPATPVPPTTFRSSSLTERGIFANDSPNLAKDITVSDTLLVPYTPSPNDSGRDNSPAGSVICHEETVLEGPSTSKMGHQTETFNRPIARSSDPATPVPPTTFRSSSLTERGIFANDSPNLAKDITVSDTLLVPYTPSPNDSGRDNSPAGSVICHEETVLEGPSTSKMGHQTETFNRPIARSSDPATPVPPTTFRSSSLTERGIFANDSPNLAKDITVSDTLLVPYTPSPNDSGRDNSPAGSVICHEETVLEGPSTSKMGHQTETFNRPIARSSDPATPVPPTTFRSSSLTERGIFANDSPNLAKDITVSDTLLVPYTPSPNDSGRDNSPAGSVICHEETVLEGPSTSKMGHQTETFNRPIARSSDPATPVPPTTFRSSSLTERGIFANDSPNLAKDITVSDTLLVPYTPSPNDSGRDNSPAGSVICHEETVLEGPSTSKMGHQTETFNRPIARSSDPATPVTPTTFRAIFANDSPNLSRNTTASDTLLVPNTPSPNDSGRDNSPAGSVICLEETVLEGPSTSKMGGASTASM